MSKESISETNLDFQIITVIMASLDPFEQCVLISTHNVRCFQKGSEKDTEIHNFRVRKYKGIQMTSVVLVPSNFS